MTPYQYQVIRYLPDHFTGEFANIGVIVFAPKQNFLACRVTSRYARLSEFFGEVHGSFLLSSLKHIETSIRKAAEDLTTLMLKDKSLNTLDQITSKIVPYNDGALQLSPVIEGLDVNAEVTVEDLFERIVLRYNGDAPSQRHTDQYAWSKVYKTYFDKYGITNKLKKHTVKTKKDAIEFDRAWKNGVWNCYQPLSLDLKAQDAIKNKVYKWSGKLKELGTTKEKLKLYFLTTSLKEHKELEPFIYDTLKLKDDLIEVTIIEEQDAEAFVSRVRKDMEKNKVIGEDEFEF